MNQEKEGEIGLRHEPEPGYRTFFYVVLFTVVVYLVIIMVATL